MSVCIVDWICSIYLIDSAHWMCHYWICLCLLSVGSYLLDHSFYTYFCYRYLSSSTLSSLSLQTRLKTRDFLLTNWQLTSNLQHNSDIKYFISINIKFLLSITAYKNNCKIVSVYHLLCHIRANITATIMIFQSKYVDPFKNWSDTYVQEWTDDNLRWNESEYENVKDIRVPPSTIWAPDILMYNRYNKFWRKLLHSYSISINNPVKFGQFWMNEMSFFF